MAPAAQRRTYGVRGYGSPAGSDEAAPWWSRLPGWVQGPASAVPDWLVGPVREVVGVASLIVVAMVPGAAMAAGAITVAGGAYCDLGSFCLYSGPDFTGQRVEYRGTELFCQNQLPALDVPAVLPGGARSAVNNTRGSASGIGVKIYSAPEHLVLTSIRPGAELRELDDGTARKMQSLCAFPSG
jgi:hypothetical protein